MILTPTIQRQIIEAIEEDRTAPVILPDHAYGPDGRVVVVVDRIPIDLHRHLHNVMIRPLVHHEVMRRREGVDPRNVNPWLFDVRIDLKSTRTHCHSGHEYTPENEAPPNSRGYRCLTCLTEWREAQRKPGAGVANGSKTHCPQEHEYTEKNTIRTKDGRRRCRTCTNARNAERMRARRAAEKKENPS